MTAEASAHLSEEALNDVLIGLSSPESDAHIAVCAVCRGQLEEFRSEMRMFNQASLASSEARPTMIPRASAKATGRRAMFVPAGWVLAAAVLLIIGVPAWWNYDHRFSPNRGPAPASATEDSEAQIAQDNDLLRSVNIALNTNEVSPISEYHLSERPHPRLKARPESRNR